jgi:hypothetical protein
MIGAGVYALSKEGRARFREFPEVIADDGYVRCQFKEYERGLTPGYYSVVNAPRDIPGLIKIKTRSRLGRYELKKKFPDIIAFEKKNYGGAIGNQALKIKLWPKLAVYLAVNYVTRMRAKRQYLTGQIIWERDDSSRNDGSHVNSDHRT